MPPTNSFQRLWNLSPATLGELRQEFDSALESVNGNVRRTLQTPVPLSVFEAEDGVILELDVPGVRLDALEISVEEGVLTVTGMRNASESYGKLKHCEHRYGAFTRSVRLDESLDSLAISAELADGVLSLTVPRKAEAQPRKVTVKIRTSDGTASAAAPVAESGSSACCRASSDVSSCSESATS